MVDFAAHTARIIDRLGAPVTITPAGTPARVVNAVFSTAPAEAFGLVGGYRPTLRLSADGNTDIDVGDAVLVGTRNFTVTAVNDDHDAGDRVLTLESV